MKLNTTNYFAILKDLESYKAGLIAVSKLQKSESVLQLYTLGQKDFGENYVQECLEKFASLPKDIRWHFIGHLQSNKVKFIVPFVHLIHGVDSLKLLKEINKQAEKHSKIQQVLLQIHIAQEETKFGFSLAEATELFASGQTKSMRHIQIEGFMGMATMTEDLKLVREEFFSLKEFYDRMIDEYPNETKGFQYLSMGMTADYKIALEEGSNLVRIGSAIFGERENISL